MAVNEIYSKSALYKLNRRGLPYKYDLNIYRGCTHNCKYCYAVKSHKYMGSNEFSKDIFVKKNIAELLDQELAAPGWTGNVINIGGVCDSYQHVEKKYQLMRDVLKVMIKYKNPVVISTKSDLIIRDFDLIEELSHSTLVNIAVCITTCDGKISEKVEPGASLPGSRVDVLKELSRTQAYTGFHFMPILPFLSDDNNSLEQLVRWASEAEVSYMLSGFLYLTGGIKKRYLDFIKKEYPDLYTAYLDLYPRGGADKGYKNRVHTYLALMRKKYNVNNNYSSFFLGYE